MIVAGLALACLMIAAAAPGRGEEAKTQKPPTTAEVLAAAKADDWRPLDPENTLYLELAGGRVVIELAPRFAPQHAANVKALARERYFDGLAILRVQDNYVVQWGDPNAEDPAKARKILQAQRTLPPEFDRAGDEKLAVHARCPTATSMPTRSGSSTASPAPATKKAAAPGWSTATAWSAPAAATRPTAAAARRSTW